MKQETDDGQSAPLKNVISYMAQPHSRTIAGGHHMTGRQPHHSQIKQKNDVRNALNDPRKGSRMFLEGRSNFKGRYALLPGYSVTHDPFVVIRAAQIAAYTSLAFIMALKRAVMARPGLQLRRSSWLGMAVAERCAVAIGCGGH